MRHLWPICENDTVIRQIYSSALGTTEVIHPWWNAPVRIAAARKMAAFGQAMESALHMRYIVAPRGSQGVGLEHGLTARCKMEVSRTWWKGPVNMVPARTMAACGLAMQCARRMP